jgi:hypothetical protein
MRGKTPHSGIWRRGQRQDLPSLAEVCGAEHVALFARCGLSTPGNSTLGSSALTTMPLA